MFRRLAKWHEALASQYRGIADVYEGKTMPWDEALKVLGWKDDPT